MGSITRFKARLVAWGFEQKYGIDYGKMFAPVARAESARVLLAVCVIKRYQMVQFDVATAFLNGELAEEVYIEAPEGMQVKKGECLKLKRHSTG